MIDWEPIDERVAEDFKSFDVLGPPVDMSKGITRCTTCDGPLLYPGSYVHPPEYLCRECGYAKDPAFYEKRWGKH